MKLRSATQNDILQILNLENLSFNYDQITKAQFSKFIQSKNILRVLEINRKIVAYSLILIRSNSSKARLYSLCVDPAEKGKGLGRKMMADLVDELKSKGFSHLKLEVKKSNQVGINLYMSMGFVKTHEVSEFYSDGETAIVFELNLKKD